MPYHGLRTLALLAILTLGLCANRAEAANTNATLTVNCTFTISKDVNIVWSGTAPAATGTGSLSWNIGAATLGGTYSTLNQLSPVWIATAPGQTLTITNSSMTGEPVNIALDTAVSGYAIGSATWTEAATAGANQYAAACVASNSAPISTAAILNAAGSTAPIANLASLSAPSGGTATSQPLWFALGLPTSITTGGATYTIAYVFTGTAP